MPSFIILLLFIWSAGALAGPALNISELEQEVARLEKIHAEISETPARNTALPQVNNGRLTLTSGTAVTTADVTGAGSIYFTSFHGNNISLYDGTRWKIYKFSEVSLALSMTTDYNYDVFLYDNGGTLTMELSAAWNATGFTRTDAIVLQDGVYVKSGTPTRRYLGTIRATAPNVTEDSLSKRFVWNVKNRVPRPLYRTDNTGSWSYASSIWRALNNSTANRVSLVVGLADSLLLLTAKNVTSSTGIAFLAIGEDSASTPVLNGDGSYAYNNSGALLHVTANVQKAPTIGHHFYQTQEYATAHSLYYGGADSKIIGVIDG